MKELKIDFFKEVKDEGDINEQNKKNPPFYNFFLIFMLLIIVIYGLKNY